MWHKAIWKGHPMRLELTRIGLLAELANHYTTRGALINWFECHINLSWISLFLEIRELQTSYVYIYIFCVVFLSDFFAPSYMVLSIPI